MLGNVSRITSGTRRNDGRMLVVVIESGDTGAFDMLGDLSSLTRTWVETVGHDTSAWPENMFDVLHGERATRQWIRADDFGENHRFAMVDCGDYDVLFAVSSRRQRNAVGRRSENVATNLLLEILETPGEDTPRRYGVIAAYHSARVLRHAVAGAFILDYCREWDVMLVCSDLRFDPLVDPSPYGAVVTLTHNAESANHLIVNSSAHRISAHESGRSKWSRATTTPIVSVHPETRELSWDREVAEALREAVKLRRAGLSWDDIAEHVGASIPSYRLRAEPDTIGRRARPNVRSRTQRNEWRRRAEKPPVPLKLLPDGSLNPAYRPESILDLPQPGAALRSAFLGGAGLGGKARCQMLDQVDSRLGGLHPDNTTLELLATGVFRRLVIDQPASNRTIRRYSYAEYQLPPFETRDDGTPVYVLDRDDIEFLKRQRSGQGGTGRVGTMPLIGIFSAAVTTELHTSDGTLRGAGGNRVVLVGPDGHHAEGQVDWSTGNAADGRVYRVWFSRAAERHKTRRTLCVARIHAPVMHRSLIDAITDVIDKNPGAASFEVPAVASPEGDRELERSRVEQHEAEAALEGAVAALAAPDLTPLVRARLQQMAADAEERLVAANHAVETAKAAALHVTDDQIPLDHLVDVLAALELPVPLAPAVAERIQRRLGDLLRDARITVDPDTQEVCWSATLELRADTGLVLRLPIDGRVPNEAKDPWLAGPPGTFWARRCTMDEAMRAHGLVTAVTRSNSWRRHVERRLLDEAQQHGVQWRGPNALNLFLRSPYSSVIAAGFAIVFDEVDPDVPAELVEQVRATFFSDADDLPHARAVTWVQGSTKSEPIRPLLELLHS